MPKQLTFDEPRQLDLLSSSGRPVTRTTADENDERPGADARSGEKTVGGALSRLRDVVGDCYACGMPAYDFGTGGRRQCCDCGRGLCDPIAGCDCGPAMLQPRGPMCWDCYHGDEDDDDD